MKKKVENKSLKSLQLVLGVLLIGMFIFGSFVYTLSSRADRQHIRVVYNQDIIDQPLFDLNSGVWVSDGDYPGVPHEEFYWSTNYRY